MHQPATIREIKAGEIVRRLVLSWLFSVLIQYMLLPSRLKDLSGVDGIANMSFVFTVLMTLLGTLILTVISMRLDTAATERILIAATFGALSAVSLTASFSPALLAACAVMFAILAFFAVRGSNADNAEYTTTESKRKSHIIIVAVISAVFFIFVSAWTVCRVLSFSAPTYDFGIFSQMFHSMSTEGIPVTTLERDGRLSHFAVHLSPIYYLLLPFYMLFPFPATLQVLQAAVITSSVIPLWLIAKKHGFSGKERILITVLLLLYPAFSGGTAYDIHENCFLTPLILWLLYAVDSKNSPLTAAAAILILFVKEDAAVYAAVIALWLIVSSAVNVASDKKERTFGTVTGLSLFVLSLLWFFAATGYLSSSGDGVMTYRYSNLMYGGSTSLATMVKAVVMCPMKAIFECVDKEKISFIVLTLAPLLGLPLFTRKYHRYILLIPYILINLMSDYQYQHDIFFQYTFGSTALLVYLTLVNLADIKPCGRAKAAKTVLLLSSVALSGVVFFSTVVPRAEIHLERYTQNSEQYSRIRDSLALVPDGASVAATTFYTVPLSDRETVYDIKHSSREHVLSCDYMVLSVTDEASYRKYKTKSKSGFESFTALLEEEGYRHIGGSEGVIGIYEKTNE